MRRLALWSALFSGLVLFAIEARAQSAFVEGHVFNFQSGRPIANAKVDILVGCAICRALPIQVGTDVTDRNGFYEVEASLPLTESPLGFDRVFIQVSCSTRESTFSGSGTAIFRQETLRRDIYLRAPVELVRCGGIGLYPVR